MSVPQDRSTQRVFAAGFQAGDTVEQFGFRVSIPGDHFDHRRSALGQRPRFVEGHRRKAAGEFHEGSPFNQYPLPGGGSNRGDNTDGC